MSEQNLADDPFGNIKPPPHIVPTTTGVESFGSSPHPTFEQFMESVIEGHTDLEVKVERLMLVVKYMWDQLMPKPIDFHDKDWDKLWAEFNSR